MKKVSVSKWTQDKEMRFTVRRVSPSAALRRGSEKKKKATLTTHGHAGVRQPGSSPPQTELRFHSGLPL